MTAKTEKMYTNDTTLGILMNSVLSKNDKIREYPEAGSMNAESTECVMCPEIILRKSGTVCPRCRSYWGSLLNVADTEIRQNDSDDFMEQDWYKALEHEHGIAMGSGNVSMVGMTYESDGEEVEVKVETSDSVAVPVDYKGDGNNYDAWIFVKDQLILAKAQGYLMGANQLVKLLEAEGLDTPESTVYDWIVGLKTSVENETTVDNKKVKIPANIVSFIKKHADVFVASNDVEAEIIQEIKNSIDATLVFIFKKTGKMPKKTTSRRVKESVAKEARTPKAKKAPKPVAHVGFGGTRAKVCGCGSTACDRSSKGCNSKGVKYEPVVESCFPGDTKEEELFEMDMAA